MVSISKPLPKHCPLLDLLTPGHLVGHCLCEPWFGGQPMQKLEQWLDLQLLLSSCRTMKIQGLSPRRISHDGRCRLTKKTPLKGMENYRLRWNLTLPNPVSLYMLLHLPIMHCPVLLTYSTSNDTSSFGIADLSFVIVAL